MMTQTGKSPVYGRNSEPPTLSRRPAMSAALCLLVLGGAPNALFAQSPAARGLIEECIQRREALPPGELSITLNVYRTYRSDDDPPTFSDTFHFIFSAKKMRIVASQTTIVDQPDGTRLTTKSTRTLASDGQECMDFNVTPGTPEGSFALRSTDPTAWNLPFLPKGLGMSGFPYHKYDRTRALLGNADFDTSDAVVDEVAEEGERTWRISGCKYLFRASQGQMLCDVTVWIAPGKGMSVKRIDVRSDGAFTSTLVNSLRLYEGNVWYPERSVITEHNAHDALPNRREYVVESVKFGKEPAEELFTLAGMDLPVGTALGDQVGAGNTLNYWDGTRAIPLEEWELLSMNRPRFAAESSWMVPTGVAILVAAFAAYFVYRRYFVRKYV